MVLKASGDPKFQLLVNLFVRGSSMSTYLEQKKNWLNFALSNFFIIIISLKNSH